ncbi:hypothetical protein [Streptosporangium sp. H16]|uniref:hypothetical protein n=1 Tax=Streptosporangium sp. H16 TaxID=3444184 RepID=UPI003F79A791
MTALWTAAGILLYAAGFVAALRVLLHYDDKHHFLGENEDWGIAALWPFVLLIVAFIAPWVGLYRIATRDRRARKHTEAP